MQRRYEEQIGIESARQQKNNRMLFGTTSACAHVPFAADVKLIDATLSIRRVFSWSIARQI
jgi:hypothetical protein